MENLFNIEPDREVTKVREINIRIYKDFNAKKTDKQMKEEMKLYIEQIKELIKKNLSITSVEFSVL